MQRNWLDQTSHQQTGVECEHRRLVPGAELDSAVQPAPGAVALGDNHLGQSLHGDRADQQHIPDHRRSQCQRSMTSSEQNPGPIASITPGLPPGGRLAIVSRSTGSTEADDRLPTSLSERHVNSRASSGNPSDATIDSITLGPPAWLTHAPMSAMSRSCSARNRVTSSARYRSTMAGTSAERMRPNPDEPIFQPIVFC